LQEQGIISGFEDGSFHPLDHVSRAEVLKIILNTVPREVISPEEPCFRDISLSSWQAKYVCTSAEQGIAKGYEDGDFRPS